MRIGSNEVSFSEKNDVKRGVDRTFFRSSEKRISLYRVVDPHQTEYQIFTHQLLQEIETEYVHIQDQDVYNSFTRS